MRAILSGLMLSAVALVAPALVLAADALDGKSFEVVTTMPNGRQEDNTYSFKDGKLKSASCAIQGYPPAAYTVKQSGDKTMVNSVLTNGRGGTHTVNATIVGNEMTGTVDVVEDGVTTKRTLAPGRSGKAGGSGH